ncbi:MULTISPECIES: RNA polymerase sigma factor [Bacillota]|jgi:RNA polymerase sigma factor (sigma-70 family)|uniref:RNA polymerase sigma factor n=2 Tax=Amedibacillus TaxID=2749846 RepID=A0A7G9GPK7_9FIRM|nr:MULTISPECIES: sigma-70 family RNA polymerase sigma factor [Bacillota]QNM12739.1 sigma-70 family RNA polymerase sigma factor [[Eubacterium] hominis]MCH4287658.1 sigma-70 family RNA polymerase sigma factor [Amedibacillus hominis]RGB52664.1 sigma-70 family RNA polymerase sigma factor [Absiella sp. AM10-20]RGB58300.1 sigma-70 family RNA polymerase sigma factor [Absiella sp. AM22-9]RGB63011.1 sigma-70 family RNA polymerase sigma factor [Absiella sp. AM09-45]
MEEHKKKEYEDIYKNYAGIVYGYLLKKCYQEDLAEELTQETFLIALKKLDTYDHTCKVSTWLCGIANNLLKVEFRKKKTVELDENHKVENHMNWDSVEVLKLVHGLTDPYREVIYLRLAANLSFAQIGEILGKSENWARVTFYRGKTKIKEGMQDEDTM